MGSIRLETHFSKLQFSEILHFKIHQFAFSKNIINFIFVLKLNFLVPLLSLSLSLSLSFFLLKSFFLF